MYECGCIWIWVHRLGVHVMSAGVFGHVCDGEWGVCVLWVTLSRLTVGLPPLNSPHEALSIWSLDFPLTTSMIIIKV